MLFIFRFLYTNNVTPDCDNVMHLLYVAKKYSIVNLEEVCLQYLHTFMTSENVCTILETVKLYDEEELYKKSMAFIEENGKSVLESEGFLNLSHQTLMDIVKSNNLMVKEDDIFIAINTWAEHQCKEQGIPVTPAAKREALGDVIKHIRFPCLSQKAIAITVSQSGLLTVEEQLHILQHKICPDEVPSEFPTTPRPVPKTREIYVFM